MTDAELRDRIERAISVADDRAVVDPYVRAVAELYARTAAYFAALDAWRDCDGPPRDVDSAERHLRDGMPAKSCGRIERDISRPCSGAQPPPGWDARVLAKVDAAKHPWWRKAWRWLTW